MNILKLVRMMVGLAIIISVSGCASMMSYNSSKEEILRSRIYASGNKKAIRSLELGGNEVSAIRAVQLSDGGAGIGIDISNLQALGLHPFRQFGAAVLDAGMLYGAYKGVESLNNSNNNNDSTTTRTAGGDNNDITVNGDGNTVRVGDENDTNY